MTNTQTKAYVITDYTPNGSSGYTWLAHHTPLVEVGIIFGEIAALTPSGITRLLEVEIPETWDTADYLEYLNEFDGFDELPAIYERNNLTAGEQE